MTTHRRTVGSRLALGLVAILVVLGGLASSAGTEAGFDMAADLLGLALWIILGVAVVQAARRWIDRNGQAPREKGDLFAWLARYRNDPTYSSLPGNQWYRGPTDDPSRRRD